MGPGQYVEVQLYPALCILGGGIPPPGDTGLPGIGRKVRA